MRANSNFPDLVEAIDALPPLREVISAHGLRAEKGLGQNFLLDLNITQRIVKIAGNSINLENADIFEIGPGPGGLTRAILRANPKKLTAVEFDNRAVNALQGLVIASNGKLEVRQANALDISEEDFPAGSVIIANLPYNIATPLLINWLRIIRNNPNKIASMTLMFQKEVAERIVASPSSKNYGRISVISNWLCKTEIKMKLPPSVFTPAPKVHSCVVNFTPKMLNDGNPEFSSMEKITGITFGQRRKMLRKSLSGYPDILEKCKIQSDKRPEQLSVEEFTRLAKEI